MEPAPHRGRRRGGRAKCYRCFDAVESGPKSSNAAPALWPAAPAAPAPATAPAEDAHPCQAPPAGIVSWLAGEGNGKDIYFNRIETQEEQTYAPGKVGQAFVLRGTTVKILASPKTDVGGGTGMTWEAWINPSDVLPMHPIFDFNNGTDFGVHLWIFSGQGALYGNFMDTNGMPHMVTTQPNALNANEWQHIALTYDKKTTVGTIYVNGLPAGEKVLGPFRPQTSYDLYLGYRPAGLGKGMRFSGLMDEPSLYSRALSAAEIKSIYNAGASGKCNPQAAKPTPTPAVSKTEPTPTPVPTPTPTPKPTPTMIPAMKAKQPIAVFSLEAGEGVSSEVATQITDALVEELRKAGFQVKPRQHMDKQYQKLAAEPSTEVLAPDVRAAALRRRAATEMQAHAVLAGRIEQLETPQNKSARLKLKLLLIDAATGRVLPDIVVSESTEERAVPEDPSALTAEIIKKVAPLAVERMKPQVQ
jgi:hypothetical protein